MYNKKIIAADVHVTDSGQHPCDNKEIIAADVHVADNSQHHYDNKEIIARDDSQYPHYVTPQQQLWRLTNEQYHAYLASTLRYLKNHAQEDLCLALVAYIRFGIRRTFINQFMARVFADCICVLDHI